jgi:hypothetical protein
MGSEELSRLLYEHSSPFNMPTAELMAASDSFQPFYIQFAAISKSGILCRLVLDDGFTRL